MKTKELIRLLAEADPSGEIECCIDNHDIHFVYTSEAYWDGYLEVLEREQNNHGYNIIGAEYVDTGKKLNIRSLSTSDAILSNPYLPIRYNGNSVRYREYDNKMRQRTEDLKDRLLREVFYKWLYRKAEGVDIETSNRIYTELGISDDDPFIHQHPSTWS